MAAVSSAGELLEEDTAGNNRYCATCQQTREVVSPIVMEACNCNNTDASGISEYGTAMRETLHISRSNNSEGAGLASTSGAPPFYSNLSYDTNMGQQSREHAIALQEMERITPLRLIDVEKSVSQSRVVYATHSDVSPATYIALSHVWAKDVSGSNATHVGVEWRVHAFKEENMKEVLRIVRDCGVHFLWVDAYCINQSDKEEKGREIPRMGSYYRNASSVFILPNGVDNIYEESIVLGQWRWHFCMWTQRVWTVPELSLAEKPMVFCCLRKEQGQRVRLITTRDLDKNLDPVKIEHHFPLNDDKEIIVIDIKGYSEIARLKASGYLDGNSDDNINQDDAFTFVEVTQRTLSGILDEENQKINQWIRRIVTRDCEEDADRVHAMLPILNMNLAFVNTSNDLNGVLAKVFEEADIAVLTQLMLATKTSGYGSKLTIYPMLKMINPQGDEAGDMLVHMTEEIHLDNGISMSFVVDTELVLKDVIVTKPVTVQKFTYDNPEDISSDDGMFGNTAYKLGENDLPCCVGKCDNIDVELVRLGTVGASDGDKFRMLEMKTLERINMETLVLVCCLACSRHDGFLEKVGVLLVEEGTFHEIAMAKDTIRLR